MEQIQSLLLMGTPALHIRLFGPLELAWGNEPLTSPPSPTTRSLLAYLIFHHDHPITRDRLTGIFWPERPDTRARHALSNALWQVRHALGPAADRLAAERDTITLTLQACDDLDAATFETQVQREPNQAIALYRADLLEGCYDDWVVPERERLRELHLGALERLIDVHKQRGDYDQALLCARRLVAADPLREAAHCEVMRLSHLLGRSQAALEQFATLRDLLAEELGVDPVPATVDLYEEIGAALGQAIPYTPIAPPPPPLLRDLVNLPFIGRTEERGALLEALHAAAQGQGRLALIEGDAGVGKTRLVDEAIADARWRGFQVGMGKGDVATTPSPYRVLRDALAPLLTELRVAQLAEVVEPLWLCVTASIFPFISEHLPDLPALARLEPQEEKQRLWEGLARLLAGLASVAPLLLVLEDIHWADEATLDALLPLALSLPAARLALTLTYRTAEARERPAVWEALEALDRVLPPTRLYLHPFERAETAALVRRALGIGETGGQVDAFAARLYEETGGNALLLVENLKVLLERDLLTPAGDGGWILPPGDVPLLPPVSIQGLIGERLARLAPPLRATLELVAVLGEEAEFAVLSGVSGAGSPRLLPTLEGLTQRGFLVEAETRYHFRHDCIQEVAYGAIALGERQWTHHRAGVVLERLHPERIEALAHHYERGHAWDKAVHYHWRAGEHAAGLHAYPVALHHYSRAVSAAEAAGLSPDERFDLLAAREAVLEVLGRREEQAADLEVMEQLAVGEGDPRKLAEVYRRRAWLLAHASRYDEAEEVIRKALALAEQQRDETAKAAALIAQGMIVGGANRVGQAVLHLREAVEIYRQQGDRAGEARARSALGDALASMTSLPAAEAETQSALSLYQSLGDRLGEIDTLVRLGRLLLLQGGDKAAATTCHQRTLEVARQIGYRYAEMRTLINLGVLLSFQGKLDQALECFNATIPIAQATRECSAEVIARINRAWVYCTFLGDEELAQTDAEEALASREAATPYVEGSSLSVLGQIALQNRRWKEARSYLEKSLDLLLSSGGRWGAVQAYFPLILLALEEGQPREALWYVDEAESICCEYELADWAVTLLASRGLVLLALGQPEAALAATTEALERLTPGVERSYLIFFYHYQVLKALNRIAEARAAIEQAYEMLSQTLEGFSSEQRAMSLERVPEHRAIVAAWESFQPQRTVVRLPHANAPSAGRPLRNNEWVEVTWTVAAPEDDEMGGKVARRRHRLLRLLREAAEQSAAPTVGALSAALDVGERTIKRDLAALRAESHDVHTRGSR